MPNRLLTAAATLAAAACLAGCITVSVGSKPPAGPPDPAAQERAFLETNAKAKGVVSLPGVQYMVLRSGPADGPHPKRSDDVTVRYEGRFVSGEVFNTSPRGGLDPTTFELGRLIPGWVATVQMMRPGDEWMIYIPSNLAYGEAGKGPIPPNRTLIFRVELISVAPHAETPPAK
jgi:peptidylprolyl isomerase/FKBP-type peptidyl-prolyl cis-trans isomerase FklB